MHDEEYEEIIHIEDDKYIIPDKIVFGIKGIFTNVVKIGDDEYKINSSHQTKRHFYATLLKRDKSGV